VARCAGFCTSECPLYFYKGSRVYHKSSVVLPTDFKKVDSADKIKSLPWAWEYELWFLGPMTWCRPGQFLFEFFLRRLVHRGPSAREFILFGGMHGVTLCR
jgi:hypothetical protein